MKRSLKKARGFTLIEILVVIGIIAILAAVVIIAINPTRQFAQARETQRESNVNTILNAIGQNLADNKGIFTCGTGAIGVSTASSTIISAATTATVPAGLSGTKIDLSCLTPTYVTALPTDPDTAWAVTPFTGYEVSSDANGRVLVCAPRAGTEASLGSPSVCVKR